MEVSTELPKVVIAGGGVAGVESVLALDDLARGRAQVTLVGPDDEFVVRPLAVEQPFSHRRPERHRLEPTLAELGVDYVRAAVTGVDPDGRRVELGGDRTLDYDFLVVCVGGSAGPAYRAVETFWSDRTEIEIDDLIDRADRSFRRTLEFVVPPAPTWPLPLYELALLTRRRAEEVGRGHLRIRFLTSEPEPLIVFGRAASEAVASLLAQRAITLKTNARVVEDTAGGLHVAPGGQPLGAAAVVALPVIAGRAIAGLPCSPSGFLAVDAFGRVEGVDDVYAAGDITDFPVKQGGIATQQADTACEHLAARLGVEIDPEEFTPRLSGQLITGGEPLSLNAGTEKIAGRYLSGWLGHADRSSGRG